ncbi:MAG: endonuclease/exonuclease/phosphatase family protein [Candidatus Omnitrophica bacterium]|nr:endonuclease/exonuclease/phosphatase family protein [Candidatus Omnitrophota bacterium]MBU1996536.1 endonuclease/exonuclease/phosphatase family protein [Candidatus Omnitrophota bacterium]MBU4333978.1 endonuclease/exonuclease/phosphatase family protein [Candidatus Omnitrophota bacterium]
MKTKPITKIRVMTYNVHSCRGLDGRVLPERIARVIEQFNPDLVALQELDVNRRWSKRMDQPHLIAQHLRMQCHFQSAIAVEGEHYGIAILSRYPFEIKKSVSLPSYPKKSIPGGSYIPFLKHFFEPRHAIWTSVTISGREIYFVNTHLSLRVKERFEQVKSILGQEWLNMDSHKVPTIFCGDFNEGPRARGHQLLKASFDEVKSSMPQKSSRKTLFSPLPLFEVDHIFYNGNLCVESVNIPNTPLTRIASDHLPLIADFNL